MAHFTMTADQATTVRRMAAELLTESIERGDQDDATVDWAVNRLLQRSRERPSG